jgi:hypothetical protein
MRPGKPWGGLLVGGLGVALGLVTAAADVASPWGDDTGKVVLLLWLVSAALLGFLRPARPWRWAPLVGLWLPLAHLVLLALGLPDTINPNTWSTAAILVPVALAACLIGAYGGAFLRKASFLP